MKTNPDGSKTPFDYTKESVYENIELAGRGLDIPGLRNVYILIPAYTNYKDFNMSLRQIKQAVGRVGRAGAVGLAHIYLIDHLGEFTGTTKAEFDALVDGFNADKGYNSGDSNEIPAEVLKKYKDSLTKDQYIENDRTIDDIMKAIITTFN